MTRLVIRAATPADISSIVKVSLLSTTKEEIQGFSASEWATYSSIEELRKAWAEENRLKDGLEIIVAEGNERVVGFIVFRMESDHGYIDNIDVVKDEQRKGLAELLLNTLNG